jgi:hypothetical protein
MKREKKKAFRKVLQLNSRINKMTFNWPKSMNNSKDKKKTLSKKDQKF